MTPVPNIFSFATSELTQDAFLAYLIDWSRPQLQEVDPVMHLAGTEFVKLLLSKHGIANVEIASVEVRVQVKRIDVLVHIGLIGGTEYVLVIEDKIHAGSYNDLPKYLKAGCVAYPAVDQKYVLGIYLRTGNQADYSAITEEKFEVIDRQALLTYFKATTTGSPENVIFQNYRRYLEDYQERLDRYKELPIAQWNGDAWMGFYRQVLLPDESLPFHDCGYVSNRSGGFYGCWKAKGEPVEFQGQPVYIQFEGSNTKEGSSYLVFKMGEVKAVQPGEDGHEMPVDRISLIRTFSAFLLKASAEREMRLYRPSRLRAGRWMSAAVVDAASLGDGQCNDQMIIHLHQLNNLLQEVAATSV